MRFLFMKATETIRHIPDALISMGHEVIVFEEYKFGKEKLADTDERYQKLAGILTDSAFDYVISFNFFEEVSDLCQKLGIYYISWAYDSPLMSLFQPAAKNPNNILFAMDRMQQAHLKQYGINTDYMPLASDMEIAAGLEILARDETMFGWDISFVGSMYEANTYNASAHAIPPHVRDELNDYLMRNLCKWPGKRPWPALSSEAAMLYKQADENIAKEAGYLSYEEYFGINVLTRKLAEMERLTALNRLSAAHPVTVFTSSQSPHLSSINGHVFPTIDYQTDMYKVFHLSRINLNFTMPSIESGIPLRVFDIMSVGGFCLTNRQEEAFELFEVGKEIETYGNLEELYDKTDFYLRHEDLRLRIAMNGYMAVRDRHNYGIRLKGMLKSIG